MTGVEVRRPRQISADKLGMFAFVGVRIQSGADTECPTCDVDGARHAVPTEIEAVVPHCRAVETHVVVAIRADTIERCRILHTRAELPCVRERHEALTESVKLVRRERIDAAIALQFVHRHGEI